MLGMPKLLWAMGVVDLRASAAVVDLLLERAQRARANELAALREVTRRLAPLLWAARVGGGEEDGAFGPFVSYPPGLQVRVLAVLHAAGQLSAALRRALAVLARDERVSPSVRSRIVEVAALIVD